MNDNEKPKPMRQVIQIDEARIKDHFGEMVRGTVEEALNAMLDAEADQLCGAGRYERSEGRRETSLTPPGLTPHSDGIRRPQRSASPGLPSGRARARQSQ